MRLLLFTFSLLLFLIQGLQAQTTISQFPYFNGFEGAGSITDWTNDGGFDWQLVGNTSGVHNGQAGQYSMFADGSVNHVYDPNLATAIWESPVFEFNGESKDHDLSFQYKLLPQTGQNYDWGTLRVQVKVNHNDWVTILTNGGLTSDWVSTTINLQQFLSVAGSGTAQMKLRFLCAHDGHSYSTINNDMWIDNIQISGEIPAPEPQIPNEVANLYDTYSGQISAIGQYSGFAPSRAFDNDQYSFWNYLDEDSWIQYDIPGCVQFELDEFQIQAYDDDYAPTKFWIYGAIEGGQWEEIHYSCCESWNSYQTKAFDINSSQSYGKFKLEVTDTEQGAETAISEIDLLGHISYAEPNVLANYANSGPVTFHSGVSEYDNKTSKAWLIKPMDGSNVRLSFDSFDFTCPSDHLRIYDGENRGAPLLGEYRTSYVPDAITSSGNALYVEFLTSGGNGTDIGQGFTASYESTDFAQSTYPWTQVDNNGFVLDGRLGINTPVLSDEFDMLVNGGLVADELVIESLPGAPDYVFEADYDLKSLQDIQNYIDEYGHLPEVPSAMEFEESGMSLGEMNLLLLKKIEELTLHMIRQQAEIDSLKSTKD
ncbi:MAG: CUB domain-containing protein [Cyclobacteriaceae bacterium]